MSAPASSHSAWHPPATAPRDGTLIIADFGWPWACPAVWDEYDEQWVVAHIQQCPMRGGKRNSYLETDAEANRDLRGWQPMPALPPARRRNGPLTDVPL